MKREKSSKCTHRPTGHCARDSAVTGRRLDAAVMARLPLPRCWPLMSSMRLNSSSKVLLIHRCHRRRNVCAAGAPSAAWPAFVSASFEPRHSASLPAWTSHGQANARIGPIVWSRCSFFSVGSKKSPPSSTSAIRCTAAAEVRRVLALTATRPRSIRRSTACRSRGAAGSMSRRASSTRSNVGVSSSRNQACRSLSTDCGSSSSAERVASADGGTNARRRFAKSDGMPNGSAP